MNTPDESDDLGGNASGGENAESASGAEGNGIQTVSAPLVNTSARRLAILTALLAVVGGYLTFDGVRAARNDPFTTISFGWVSPVWVTRPGSVGGGLGDLLTARTLLVSTGMLVLAVLGFLQLMIFTAWRRERAAGGLVARRTGDPVAPSTAARPLWWFAGALTVLGLWLVVAGLAYETANHGSYDPADWWTLFLPRAVGAGIAALALAVLTAQAVFAFGAWRHDIRAVRT